jgi:hypothetical protein
MPSDKYEHDAFAMKRLLGLILGSLAIVGLLVLLYGQFEKMCPEGLDQRFFSDELVRTDLVGYWVITPDSVCLLRSKCGYVRYLNRSDHVLKLNADGTCVFRGYDCYFGPELLAMMETDVDGRHLDSYWYGRTPNWLSTSGLNSDKQLWYAWQPLRPHPLSGPMSNTQTNEFPGSRLCVSRWSYWSVVDRGSKNHKQDPRRYLLNFYPEGQVGGAKYESLSNFRIVGKSHDKIVLWAPIIRRLDEAGELHAKEVVRFVKMTESEFSAVLLDEARGRREK